MTGAWGIGGEEAGGDSWLAGWGFGVSCYEI